MNLKTAKAALRAANRLVKVFEPTRKTDPTAAAEYEAANKAWQRLYNRVHDMEIAAATKRDKDQVCFTVFIPDKWSMKEVIRTPNRIIYTTRYKSFSGDGGYDRNYSSYTDATPFDSPIQTFKRLNPAEVVAV